MADEVNERSPLPSVLPNLEVRRLSALEVSLLASTVRRSLPESFAEVFAADFDLGNPSEQDNVPGLGKVLVTRAVEDWGKILSLSIKDSEIDGFKNDLNFSSQAITFLIGRSDNVIDSRYTYFAIRRGNDPVVIPPNDPRAKLEIEKTAKKLAKAFGINPNR